MFNRNKNENKVNKLKPLFIIIITLLILANVIFTILVWRSNRTIQQVQNNTFQMMNYMQSQLWTMQFKIDQLPNINQ